MLKDATYKEKFAILNEWLPQIIEQVKKDLKNEHLKKDARFCKEFLGGKHFTKASVEELAAAYEKVIREGENGEAVAEFICSRWLLKNSEIYQYFASALTALYPDFTEIAEIAEKEGIQIAEQSVKEFGALKTYLFSVINSVVFSDSIYKDLEQKARREVKEELERAEEQAVHKSFEDLKSGYEVQISRLTDKYEKKLSGLEKKYHQDTETLKKQISLLQRKLNERAAV
jgi:hypothetical protein